MLPILNGLVELTLETCLLTHGLVKFGLEFVIARNLGGIDVKAL